jgi:hypothetical protein
MQHPCLSAHHRHTASSPSLLNLFFVCAQTCTQNKKPPTPSLLPATLPPLPAHICCRRGVPVQRRAVRRQGAVLPALQDGRGAGGGVPQRAVPLCQGRGEREGGSDTTNMAVAWQCQCWWQCGCIDYSPLHASALPPAHLAAHFPTRLICGPHATFSVSICPPACRCATTATMLGWRRAARSTLLGCVREWSRGRAACTPACAPTWTTSGAASSLRHLACLSACLAAHLSRGLPPTHKHSARPPSPCTRLCPPPTVYVCMCLPSVCSAARAASRRSCCSTSCRPGMCACAPSCSAPAPRRRRCFARRWSQVSRQQQACRQRAALQSLPLSLARLCDAAYV